MLIVLALALTSAALAQDRNTPPIPPISFGPMPGEPPEMLRLRPGEARCAGRAERPAFAEEPLPILVTSGSSLMGSGRTVRLTFRIDETGRPLSISDPQGADTWVAGQANDLVPAFALWRFAPGAARSDCEISFAIEFVPIARAPLPELHRVLILGQASGAPRRAAWQRALPDGSTCFSPGPNVRQQAFPAWETIPQPPGTASCTLVGFDIDARGRATDLRVVGSSGNEELDRQSLDAIRQSRYAPEARRSCTFPFWRRPRQPVAAPPMPGGDAFPPTAANCANGPTAWTRPPQTLFPTTLERRHIEGWAILSYDVAPWGDVGNVRVLAAEPMARVGTHAANQLRGARQNPGTGAAGCTFRFRFLLPRDGQQPPAASAD